MGGKEKRRNGGSRGKQGEGRNMRKVHEGKEHEGK